MENRPPSVFVSSTMHDLGDLRGGLQQFIEGLGWTPVMAERDSFSIETSATTLDNSLRNVRVNCDVFVMIIGSRYGSVDPASGKSVTNLEFLEARARGVPTYVFVDREVLAQRRVWRDNPEADFTGVVDTPRVFEFIESFYGEGDVWTFPFSTVAEIVGELRVQFSYLVRDALSFRQLARGQDRIVEELAGRALELALQRGEHWEARLFGTVLEAELDRRLPLRREIELGLVPADTTFVDLLRVPTWGQDRIHELRKLVEAAASVLKDLLPQALEKGDAIEIAAAARRLARVWEDTAQWTLRCRSVRVDSIAQSLVEALSNANAKMLDEIWEYGHTFNSRIDNAQRELTAASGEDADSTLTLTLTLTADVDEASEEIEQLQAWMLVHDIN